MALSNACHFLIFQDKPALGEEIGEPIPRRWPAAVGEQGAAQLGRSLQADVNGLNLQQSFR